MAEPVSSLLRRSVEHLAFEVPTSCRRVLDALGPLVVALDVDGEHFALTGGHQLSVEEGESASADVRIDTGRVAILDVLDANTDLQAAIEAGDVRVRGSLDDVLRVYDTLHAYVHAAVRAPGQSALVDALREAPS